MSWTSSRRNRFSSTQGAFEHDPSLIDVKARRWARNINVRYDLTIKITTIYGRKEGLSLVEI